MSAKTVSKFYGPSLAVSFLVKQYLTIKTDSADDRFWDKHIPNGLVALVFNFQGLVDIHTKTMSSRLPSYFLTLPSLGYVTIATLPPLDSFVIMCKASVFSRFFGITFDECHRQSFRTIKDVIPEILWRKIKDAASNEKRIDIFENFVLQKPGSHSYIPDRIDQAYEYIFSNGGILLVHDLIEEMDFSNRTFRRNFISRVGLSAKSISRIVRVNFLWNQLKNAKSPDFQNLVYLGKFFDQAHLINDFKKIIGEPPGTFFNRDLDEVCILSGVAYDFFSTASRT